MFTHTSWAPDRASSYERLEFLGDSVLELAIARALYDRFPEASEGRLTKIRAHVVSRQSCAGVAQGARSRALPARAGTGRARCRARPDLAQPQRARGAARGGDRGRLPRARLRGQVEQAVVEAFDARIEFARTGHVDNKTELQEALARSGNQVQYEVVDVEGPPHDRRFVCVAVIAGEQVGIGKGSTKKAAEQEAARQALEALGDGVEASASPQCSGLARLRQIVPSDIRRVSLAFVGRAPPVDQDPRLQVVRRPDRAQARAGRRRRRRPERLRQVERRRRDRLGRRLADAVRAAGREARRRALRRGRRPVRRRITARSSSCSTTRTAASATRSTTARSRSRAGSFVAARASTSSTRRPCGAPISSSSSPTSASAARCTRSSRRGRSTRCSPRSRRTGATSSRRRPGSASSSAASIAPSSSSRGSATQVERAKDVEEEVRKRLRPLALQATAAERAEKLAIEIAALRARIAQLDLARRERAPGGRRGAPRRRRDRPPQRAGEADRAARGAPAGRGRAVRTRPAGARRRSAPSTACREPASGSCCGASRRSGSSSACASDLAEAERARPIAATRPCSFSRTPPVRRRRRRATRPRPTVRRPSVPAIAHARVAVYERRVAADAQSRLAELRAERGGVEAALAERDRWPGRRQSPSRRARCRARAPRPAAGVGGNPRRDADAASSRRRARSRVAAGSRRPSSRRVPTRRPLRLARGGNRA